MNGKSKRAGCLQVFLGAALVVYLGLVPVGVAFLADRAQTLVSTSDLVLSVVALFVAGGLLLTPLGVALWFVRTRPALRSLASLVVAAVLLSGYFLLDGLVRAVFPESTQPSLHGEGADAAALRLVLLLPYVVLAAWGAPRLAGLPPRRKAVWLGLRRLDVPLFLDALALSALLTLPWPLTGALGDVITTVSLLFQTFAVILPSVLLLWGVVFYLLTSTFTRPWLAALVVIILAGVLSAAAVLPTADWEALTDVVSVLPLAFLLTELRARGYAVYPLLPVAFFYQALPLIFVDPRDALARGIPEPEHIVAHAVVLVTMALVGVLLWGSRVLGALVGARSPRSLRARFVVAVVLVLTFWGIWGGAYLAFGEVGFTNDGFLIIMEEQADLSSVATISDREERLQAVYDALVETAERTQRPIRAELNGLGVSYRSYYLINMVRVDGHRWLMARFARRPGVAQVILNPNVREYPRRLPIPYTAGAGPEGGELQPNLTAIHAPDAWSLGVTGEGIVVAGQDTGYDWTHPALKAHYRGWNGITVTHDYNWHDAWDDTAVPFDDDSHGTHTMGIVLGGDGQGNVIGVAPGARWMGCRNMRRGFGNPGSYTECMEFFLAPYPHGGDSFRDGDVSYAPHVVNNSWGCPDFEGCQADTLRPAVEALRAAGIMMVVSVGNDGPACGTASTPPANYDAVFSVGATDDEGEIVGFSSRGPAGEGLIKPDVSAPGAYVRSSVPGGEYRYAGGTSMAGPHVAGLVALLWSANPALVGDIEATEALICRTAVPHPVETVCVGEPGSGFFTGLLSNPVCACGGVVGTPNNVYGCGFVNAGAAVRAAVGTLEMR